MKISELDYNKVCEILVMNEFFMHQDASDCLRKVRNDKEFNEVKEMIMDRYGDVEMNINRNMTWHSQVMIVDDKWKKDNDQFSKEKLEWCVNKHKK